MGDVDEILGCVHHIITATQTVGDEGEQQTLERQDVDHNITSLHHLYRASGLGNECRPDTRYISLWNFHQQALALGLYRTIEPASMNNERYTLNTGRYRHCTLSGPHDQQTVTQPVH